MELYALAIAGSNDGLWDWDVPARKVYRSARLEEILGLAAVAVEATPEDWFKWLHPDDEASYRDAFRRYVKGRDDRFECKYRMIDAQGAVRWVHEYARGLRDAAGRVQRIAGSVRDITEQKRLEEELRQSGERLRDYAETASDWYWETGPDHRFINHPETIRHTVIDQAARLGKRRSEFAADLEEEPEKWRQHLAALERHEPFRDFVYRVELASGGIHVISTSGKPIFNAEGGFLGYRGSGRDVTSAMLSAQVLRESQQRFSDIAEVAGDVIWEVDRDGRFTYVAGTGRDTAGVPDNFILGKTRWELAGADPAKDELWAGHLAVIEARQPFRNFRYSFKSGTGRTLHCAVSGKPVFDADGAFCGYRGTTTNETRSVELLRRTERQADLLRMTFASMVEGIIVVDGELRVVTFNRQFLELCEYPADLVSAGESFEKIVRFGAERGDFGEGEVTAIVEARLADLRRVKPHVLERQLPRGRVLELRVSPLAQGGFVMTCVEVTERKRTEKKIVRLARIDALTNLANRAQFTEQLDHATTEGTRYNQPCALFYIDLDNLKDVNDTLGHPVGDGLLRLVGKRLSSIVREADLVARLGGDEFAVIQSTLVQPSDAATFAERLVQTLSQPYRIGGHEVHSTASVGVAVCTPDKPVSAEELMSQADTALYKAKQEGRNRFCFHSPQIEKSVRARVAMADALRTALAQRQLMLHYQPRFALPAGTVTGVEALLRWRHPNGELMSAAEFVTILHDRTLLRKLDAWVISRACRQMRKWQGEGHLLGAVMSVNIAPMQFKDPGFEAVVQRALERSGLASDRLELELTEFALMHANDGLVNTLRGLDERHVRLSVDCFGSGYTSPKLLKSLPIATAKIGAELVAELTAGGDREATVVATVTLARNLGLKLVAKGVETAEQLRRLRELGCEEVQGRLLAAPVAAAQLPNAAIEGAARLAACTLPLAPSA
ncbi:MAG: EAL domain-containing protein [Alphaproteobacteria bacterium]